MKKNINNQGSHFMLILLIIVACLSFQVSGQEPGPENEHLFSQDQSGLADREYWCKLLYKIACPVLNNLADGTLKEKMPLELGPDYYLNASRVTYMEAVGRTLAGLAPWLSLPDDNTEEGLMRSELRALALKGLKNAVDPVNPDCLNFATEYQPIVDAAYIAHAFLRAKEELWEPLDSVTKGRYIDNFKLLRTRKPWYSNWLLFSAMTETFLLSVNEQYDPLRIDVAVRKMKEWYVGDGWYSDGELFALDYYNSYVMHPMLVDILGVLSEKGIVQQADYELALKRMRRYSEFLERTISPEGTYPPLGRSITYRTGAYQALAQISLMHELPEKIKPAQVRGALTAVMKNIFGANGTFDSNGWLTLGLAGHQPMIADQYTSTGSLYICTLGFLPLGLPPSDPFWSSESCDWSAKKAWKGMPLTKDYKVDF